MLVRVQSRAQPHTNLTPLLGGDGGEGENAEVVKLVDTHVSGACAVRYAGSSPAFGTVKGPTEKSWVFAFWE